MCCKFDSEELNADRRRSADVVVAERCLPMPSSPSHNEAITAPTQLMCMPLPFWLRWVRLFLVEGADAPAGSSDLQYATRT
jgi:hypothetical protein